MTDVGISIRMIQQWTKAEYLSRLDLALIESQRRWEFLQGAPDFGTATPEQVAEMKAVAFRPLTALIHG